MAKAQQPAARSLRLLILLVGAALNDIARRDPVLPAGLYQPRLLAQHVLETHCLGRRLASTLDVQRDTSMR